MPTDGIVGHERIKDESGGLCFWPEQLEERSLPLAEMRPTAGEADSVERSGVYFKSHE